MTTLPTTEPSGARDPLLLPRAWLLSPRADLALLFGGVLPSFALFAAWQAGWLDAGHLVLLWVFVFHGPHFWATISRTYLDKAEWQARRGLLLGSLLWFVVGPALVGLAVLAGWTELQRAFFFAAALWAYHHVVKQHFGFMALYRARAGESDRRELGLHRRYIVLSLWMPALITLSGTPAWLDQIPFVPSISAANAETFLAVHRSTTVACGILFWTLQAAFVLHLLHRLRRGRGINVQETGIAVCAVALHWVVVRAVLDRPDQFYAFVPLVTIYHNLQYHALVWHYNRRRYGSPGARERHGLAFLANRNLLVYAALGLAYTLLTIGVDFYRLPIFDAGLYWFAPIASAAVWGWSFLHYFLDSRIWHLREDQVLQQVLGFRR
jgi:hypothetical protein